MSSQKRDIIDALDKQVRLMGANSVILSHTIASKVGIHPTDLECLDFLVLNGAATAGDLAKSTGLTTGAITASIDRLEKKGFVTREIGKNDRRKVMVILQDKKAHSAIAPYYALLGQEMTKLYGDLSEEKRNVILAFITKTNEITQKAITTLKVD